MTMNKKTLFSKNSNFDELNPQNYNVIRKPINATLKTEIKNAENTKQHLDAAYDKIKNDPTQKSTADGLKKASDDIQDNIDKSLNLIKTPIDTGPPNYLILLGAVAAAVLLKTI